MKLTRIEATKETTLLSGGKHIACVCMGSRVRHCVFVCVCVGGGGNGVRLLGATLPRSMHLVCSPRPTFSSYIPFPRFIQFFSSNNYFINYFTTPISTPQINCDIRVKVLNMVHHLDMGLDII